MTSRRIGFPPGHTAKDFSQEWLDAKIALQKAGPPPSQNLRCACSKQAFEIFYGIYCNILSHQFNIVGIPDGTDPELFCYNGVLFYEDRKILPGEAEFEPVNWAMERI